MKPAAKGKSELWRIGVPAKDRSPDGSIRHSQIISTFGPGAIVDLVDDAVIIAGLSWWARGPKIVEDRLTTMLRRQDGYERVDLYAPPPATKDLEDPLRKWIKAFRFPEWFVCQNEKCWDEGGGTPRRDGASPRRLLHLSQLDGKGHKCGGKGKASKVQPIRFVRACRFGHIDDIDWRGLVHPEGSTCTNHRLWLYDTGSTGDLAEQRLQCGGCRQIFPMSLAMQRFVSEKPTLGFCHGKRPWIGGDKRGDCGEPMRLLTRSASNAWFSVPASVIHIPDPDALLRERVDALWDQLKGAKSPASIALRREEQDDVRAQLDGLTDQAVYEEILRRRENRRPASKKVKEAEVEVLLGQPEALSTDQPNGRFFARTVALAPTRKGPISRIERVVLLHRLTEVRALAGFTRFEPKSTDVDGELDIGAEVARLDEPLTWLPAVENQGEGFFLSLRADALAEWEARPAVRARAQLFSDGFRAWQSERDDRQTAKADFAAARFVLLHSLSHLLITSVALECGYAASSIRERIYAGAGGSGILLYTASPGAEGSLGGLVQVGRRLERYLDKALDLGRLCANDPVCAAHAPDVEIGNSDRHLDGASCHGCLLISEPSCERMNVYLDRAFVVPTVDGRDAAFFQD